MFFANCAISSLTRLHTHFKQNIDQIWNIWRWWNRWQWLFKRVTRWLVDSISSKRPEEKANQTKLCHAHWPPFPSHHSRLRTLPFLAQNRLLNIPRNALTRRNKWLRRRSTDSISFYLLFYFFFSSSQALHTPMTFHLNPLTCTQLRCDELVCFSVFFFFSFCNCQLRPSTQNFFFFPAPSTLTRSPLCNWIIFNFEINFNIFTLVSVMKVCICLVW